MAIPIPDIPQRVQDRLNRTPAQRKADLEAKRQARLNAMTPAQRQAAQAYIDRVNAGAVLSLGVAAVWKPVIGA